MRSTRSTPTPRRFRRARRGVALTAAAVSGLGLASVADGPAAADSVHEIEVVVGTPGPLGSVSFVGDSVGIGAGRFSPTLPEQLIARGWGPVRFHAVDGKRTGLPPGWPNYFNAVPMIDEWQAAGWDSDTWIVNLGANDSGYCSADVACAKRAIMLVVDAIGPGHRIWWPKITRFYTLQHQADAWNAALDQVAAERDDFWTWDWPAEMRAHPDIYGSYDNTHLYPDGYRRRSAVMAQAFTDAVAIGRRTGDDVPLPPVTGPPAGVVPVQATRVIDTRIGAQGRLDAGGRLVVDLSGLVPATAVAAVVNLTAVDPSAPGYLTAYPCDASQPGTSNLNHLGRTRAAGAVVELSAATTLCVTSSTASDVIVDLQAALVPTTTDGALRLTPLTSPRRLVDTRESGRDRVLRVPVPSDATMVAVNITATSAVMPGYVTASACGDEPPAVSNVNIWPGDAAAGAAWVSVGEATSICISSSTAMDVIVDLAATLATDGDLAYTPVRTTRMLDTRSGVGGWSPVHGAGQIVDVGVAPAGAAAVTGTLTLVGPISPSYLAAAPCGVDPVTSNVNAQAGDVVANVVTVRVEQGRMCVTSRAAGGTVFDVSGWWTATP